MAPEVEGRHVALREAQPGSSLRRHGRATLLREAQHRGGPVDADDIETRGGKRAGHPPGSATDLEDRPTGLRGEPRKELDVALGGAPVPDRVAQDVVDLRAQAVGVDPRQLVAHPRMLDRLTCDYLVTYCPGVDDSTAPAFRALADPSRRLLLDRLFERDGQTLGELTGYLPAMTRFGVMRHLDVLESAGLISTRKVGREKRHYLNPVPIRRIHDRWISKYAAPVVGAMSALKGHLEAPPMAVPPDELDHVYSIFINASPERVWRAITDGDDTVQYYFGTRVVSDWAPGSHIRYDYPDGTVAADGEVIAVEPPNRLEMTFHARWDPEMEAEGPGPPGLAARRGGGGDEAHGHDLRPEGRLEDDRGVQRRHRVHRLRAEEPGGGAAARRSGGLSARALDQADGPRGSPRGPSRDC